MQKQAQLPTGSGKLEPTTSILRTMGARTHPRGRSLSDHLESPLGLGDLARAPYTGAAGGAACGDLVRVSVRVEGERVVQAGFDARGCAAARGAGSAAVALVQGEPILEAARVTPGAIAEELGGLARGSAHAADLAADALHRALGLAARDGAAVLPADGGPDAGGHERWRGQCGRRAAGTRRGRGRDCRDARALVGSRHRR